MWVVGAGRANNTPRLPRPLQANTSGKEGRGARSVRWSESSAPPRARRDRGVGRKRSGRCRAKEGSFWGFCLAGVERLGRRVTPLLPLPPPPLPSLAPLPPSPPPEAKDEVGFPSERRATPPRIATSEAPTEANPSAPESERGEGTKQAFKKQHQSSIVRQRSPADEAVTGRRGE